MKKINLYAFVAFMAVSFIACSKNEPKNFKVDGQWVCPGSNYEYMDINNQMANCLLAGNADSIIQRPFPNVASRITEFKYSEDGISCDVVFESGNVLEITDITDNSITCQYGTYVHPNSPFTFVTPQDLDTITPVKWTVLFYYNDTAKCFLDYQLLDSVNGEVNTIDTNVRKFEPNGRDAAMWQYLQEETKNGKPYIMDTIKIKVIMATPSIKAGKHRFYLDLKRNSSSSAMMTSATVFIGKYAYTDEANVTPNYSRPTAYQLSVNKADKIEDLFNAYIRIAKTLERIDLDFIKIK